MPVSDEIDPDYLREMVRDVNKNSVPPEEVLSDMIFIYQRATDAVIVA